MLVLDGVIASENGVRFIERMTRNIQSGSKTAIYCAECHAGRHGATMCCSCCDSCNQTPCRCGWPPMHGGKLTAREVRAIARANDEAAENVNTARVSALLAHVAWLDAELEQARRPLLPGMKQ